MKSVTDTDAACALASHPTKSAPIEKKPGMDKGRDGLPHLTPMSTRYREEHAKRGTHVEMPGKM